MSASESDKVESLLHWCADNSIFIDHRIKIRLQDAVDDQAGIGVFSLETYIPPETTLVRIPKEAVLSVRNCSLANNIPIVSSGLGAQLSLSLALFVEILKHDRSRWHGYLRSLPDSQVDLPLFWKRMSEDTGSGDAHDCAEAIHWLTGTEAAKILNSKTERGSNIFVEITNFFNDIAEPLLRKHSYVWMEGNNIQRPTIEGFYRAFSIVSSRAFLVDTYHGLSLVPIADAFNHAVENDVHLESDYFVCPECGSLDECVHDRDEIRPSDDSHQLDDSVHEQDACYEMVSDIGIAPNSEVFNTYGGSLTNAQLLNQYGFVLDVNENDRFVWSVGEVFDVVFHGERVEQDFEAAILSASSDVLGSLSNLPHFFDQSELLCHEPDGGCCDLYLNDEGKISAGLWALLAAFVLKSGRWATDNSEMQLTEIVDAQLQMESFSDQGVEDKEESSPAIDVVLQIAEAVICLCERRKRETGKSNSLDYNMSDWLEQNPIGLRTRLAISVLLTERSILDACWAGWSTLLIDSRGSS